MKQDLSRRSFLAGAGLVGVGAVAGLAGCAPQASSSEPEGRGQEQADGDWRTPPDPITDIAETIDADVVVIGAGVSGCNAAYTAAESGAHVVVLQKEATCIANGMGVGAYGTTMQKERGDDWDVEEELNRWARESENRSNRKLVHRWAEYSGEVVDRMVRLCTGHENCEPILYDPGADTEYPDAWNFAYSGGVVFLGADQMKGVAQVITDEAEKLGTDVHYSTPAVQLVRDGDGPVTAVIAQREDGSYLQVNAAKGVILAAGDYGADPDLRKEFMPHIEGLQKAYCTDTNTGDGHKMGTWVGAAMQKAPHAGNIHYDPGMPPSSSASGSGCPWLWVNLNGERFCNEDMSYGQIYAQGMNQPQFIHFQVFDANYKADVQAGKMGQGNQKNGPFPGFGMEFIDEYIENGEVLSADTLEGLAEKMGVSADAFKATVERYNELNDLGEDLDFGKQAARLTYIKDAPFYAICRQPRLLCALGGLVINDHMEVLDEQHRPIPNLYACGNNSGDWFGGLEHPMVSPGMSLGRAVVTGHLAALSALGESY